MFVVGDPKQSIYRFRRADVTLYELGGVQEGQAAALKQLFRLAYREASTLAYADAFRAIMIAFAIATLLVPFLRNIAAPKARVREAH